MTVLEWLKASTRYSFEEQNFIKIALDRECSPDADVYDESVVSKKQRELMTADIIFMAVLLSPSNTASLRQTHNGFSRDIGQEQDFYQDDKIKYAIRIYNKYDDDRGTMLDELANAKKIRIVPIVDVLRVK